MPIFTPYYWSVKKDYVQNSNSTISIKNYGRYASGDYLEYISYYSGNYLTITGDYAPTAYYFNNSTQKNNIRINTKNKSKILFDSNISGDTFTLFSNDVGIYDVTMIGNRSSNIDVSLTLNAVNLTGNIGNNRLVGNAFNNIIDGKGGVDVMIGGAGDDTYYVYSTNDTVIENPGEGNDGIILVIQGLDTYTLPNNIEKVRSGGFYCRRVNGNSLNNIIDGYNFRIIDGGAGEDTLIGNIDTNFYIVDNVNDVIIEPNPSKASFDYVESSVTWTLGDYLEELTLTGSANINGTGNSLKNTINGNSGNNIIDGKGGIDRMVGGLGDDTYYIDNVYDFVLERANEGTDTIISIVSWRIDGYHDYAFENITLDGYTNIDAIGNYRSNILIGNPGNNMLIGGIGNVAEFSIFNFSDSPISFRNGAYLYSDTLIGGKGNDTYYIYSSQDKVIELSNEGTDTVYSASSYELQTNFENLTLYTHVSTVGQECYAIGNDVDNIITGNGGINLLQGKGGNDILIGGGGVDTLDGGLGNDTFVFDTASSPIYKKSNNEPKFDTITGLEIGFDIIDVRGDTIRTLTNIGELIVSNNSFTVENIITALDLKFTKDCTILFTYNQRTFLGIDDGKLDANNKPRFDGRNDCVIEITGYSGNLSDLRVI
jgi:Ca2+-binding RTX toxin-like protein